MKLSFTLLISFFLVSFTHHAQESRIVSGTVTYGSSAIPEVNIINLSKKGSGVSSAADGSYEISVDTGDDIQFSHVGYRNIIVKIEEITKVLNIKMYLSNNELDEVVLSDKNYNTKVLERENKRNEVFKTAYGNIDPRRAGFSSSFVDGEDIASYHFSLAVALNGKIAGYSINPQTGKAYLRGRNMSMTNDYPVLWDVDGNITQNEPFDLNLDNIRAVYILKSLASTTRYVTLGAGGVIVVATKNGPYDHLSITKDGNKPDVRNTVLYDEEALSFDGNFETTIDNLKTEINHPEKLKALAYQLEEEGNMMDSKNAYESIFKIRPQYAQSFRDLANSYIANKEFDKAWRLYIGYAFNNSLSKDEGIGEIMYNEMEWLYFNREAASKILYRFEPSHKTKKDFERDIRIVFEWNTSEAEFDLEFVNPDKQVYNFEHTLEANESLITDEKTRGYSSKEFSIPEIDYRDWLINMTYYGNKKDEPTYFKVTTYYNWGRPSQKQKIKVYKLEDQNVKYQLLKYNNNSSIINY